MKTKLPFIPAAIIAVVAGSIIAVLIWLWGSQLGATAWVSLRGAAPVLLMFTAAIVLIWLYVEFEIFAMAPLAILAALVAISLWFAIPYHTDRQYVYATGVSKSSAPSFDERAPLRVAVESASRNMGSSAGTIRATKSLPDNGTWNTVIVRRGIFVGYESVQSIAVPLFGNVTPKNVTRCSFSEPASLRLGGALPHNNLGRAILWGTPVNVSFSAGDAYSYCDGDTPQVVVPLKSIHGFFAPVWRPAGVAVYNGTTGELAFSADAAGVPGPVYPLSLAKRQRTAYNASGTWLEYLTGATGFNDTSNDTDDPNGENNSEFALRATGTDDTHYVTPLSPRGDSSSITGLSMVRADTTTPGELNPLNIRLYPTEQSRVANSTVEQQLRSSYSSMTDWASGLQVFEIVPSGDGNWTASLGQKQSVVYRAIISADGSATLYSQDGRKVVSSGASAPGGDTPTMGAPAIGDLDEMTPEQLQTLANQILAELTGRANK